MPAPLKKEVHEQRRDQIRELRAQCMTSRDILDACTQAWGVGERRVFKYMKDVDDEMSKFGAALPAYERRFYESTVLRGIHLFVRDAAIASTNATLSQNVRAENRRIGIFGLERLGKAIGMFRDKVELTGANGGPLALTVTDARAQVQAKVDKIRAQLVAVP